MPLDRGLIKTQAKDLIKGKKLKLFVLILVVSLLTGSISLVVNVQDVYDTFSDNSTSDFSQFGFGDGEGEKEAPSNDEDDFDYGNFEDFTGSLSLNPIKASSIASSLGSLGGILELFLAPLAVTLMGVFLMLIRGRDMELDDGFSYIFKETFNKNYWHKFVLQLLSGIIIGIMFCLFIIPGIIFYYRYYFATMVMADKPELSGKQAIKISIKMTDNHKGELLAFDLSYIGWFFVTLITFGIAGIYTMPYYTTARALYYENFKIRAFAEGKLTAADFVTDEEKRAEYYRHTYQNNVNYHYPPSGVYYNAPTGDYYNRNNQQSNNYGYYQQNNSANQGSYYYPGQQPPNPADNYGSGQSTDYYNNPDM